MLVKEIKKENNSIELTIAIEREEFQNAISAAYKKNVKSINVPGFRRGKAPKSLVEKMYGETVFYEDAVNDTFPAAYEKAIDENNIEPVDQADIEVLEITADGYSFKAKVDVKPEFVLGKYKGFELEKLSDTVSDEEIDADIDNLRSKYAREVAVEDRPAKLEDTAEIDYHGFLNDVEFEGGKAEGHKLKLGSGQFIPGFEEQIVGKNIGEEFDVNVTFPEEYHSDELAGKPVVFKVKLHGLEETQMPKLDDEFAKDVSEDCSTFAELKESVKERIAKQKLQYSDNVFTEDIIEQISNELTIDLPDAMVKKEIDIMKSEYAQRVSQMGIGLEQYLQYMGQTMEQFEETMVEPAKKQVKSRLILENVAIAENITITEDELNDEYKKLADAYHLEVEKIKNAIPEKNLSIDLSTGKAAVFLRENSTPIIVEKKTEKEEVKEEKPAKKTPAKKAASDKSAAAKKPAAKKPATAKTKTTTAKKEEKDAE